MKKLTQFYIRTWNWWYRSDIASSTNSKCSLNWKFRHPEWKSFLKEYSTRHIFYIYILLVWYSQSLQNIYIYFIEITFLSQFCLFNTLFHVYPTTARMKNFAGLVKRHLAGIYCGYRPLTQIIITHQVSPIIVIGMTVGKQTHDLTVTASDSKTT
jgi:hypothetical protein